MILHSEPATAATWCDVQDSRSLAEKTRDSNISIKHLHTPKNGGSALSLCLGAEQEYWIEWRKNGKLSAN